MANGAGGQVVKALQPGEFLCFQGEESNEIFVLRSGTLHIYIVDAEGVVTKNKVEAEGMLVGVVDQPGSFIGEIGAILKEPRSASIKVSDDGPAQILVINLRGKGFADTVVQNPKIGFSLSKTIAQRIGITSKSITRSDSLTIKAKKGLENYAHGIYEIFSELESAATAKGLQMPLIDSAKKTTAYQIGRMVEKFGTLPIDIFGTVGIPFGAHQNIYHNRIFAKAAAAQTAPEPVGPPKPGVTAFEAGKVVCEENGIDQNLYFLLAGKLEVFVGMRTIEIIDERGAIFGENAIFGQLERTTGIRALSDVHAMPVPSAQIEPYFMKKPPLVVHVLKMFAKRLPMLNSLMLKTAQQMTQLINLLGHSPEGCLSSLEILVPRLKAETAAIGEDAAAMIQKADQMLANLTGVFNTLNAEYEQICQDIGYKPRPFDPAAKSASALTAPKFDFVTKIEELESLDSEHINFVLNPKTDQFRACSIEYGYVDLLKQAKIADTNWKEFLFGRIHNFGDSFPIQFLTFDLDTGGLQAQNRDYVLRGLQYFIERTEQQVALLYKDNTCIEMMHIPDYVKLDTEELVDEATILAIIEAFRKNPEDRENLNKLNALYWDLIIATVVKKLPTVKDNMLQFEDKDLQVVDFGLLDKQFLPDNTNVLDQIQEDKNFNPGEDFQIEFIYLSDLLQGVYKEAFGYNKMLKLEEERKQVYSTVQACQERVAALVKGRADMIASFPGGQNAAQFVQKYDNLVRGMAILERKMKAGRSISNEERAKIVQAKNVKTQINTQIAGFLTALKGRVSDDQLAQFRTLGDELEKKVLEDLQLQELASKKDEIVKAHSDWMKSITMKTRETTYKNEMIRLKKYVQMTAKKAQIDPTAVLVNIRDIATKTRVKAAMDLFLKENVDPEIFEPKQTRIKQLGMPKLMLLPGSGNAVYDWEKHLFMVPLTPPKSLEESIANALIEFHWDMDEDKSLRESYGQLKIYSKLSITKLKQQLCKDYIIWATQESKGWKKLDKEVRPWFQVKIAKQKLEK
ncbi:MAG: cyclic nucleotide-binding domain-containing protein [bacterium]